ncbi:MAG: hypothetical protein RLZZ546_2092, partial [Bacteroidota bacterium]
NTKSKLKKQQQQRVISQHFITLYSKIK